MFRELQNSNQSAQTIVIFGSLSLCQVSYSFFTKLMSVDSGFKATLGFFSFPDKYSDKHYLAISIDLHVYIYIYIFFAYNKIIFCLKVSNMF